MSRTIIDDGKLFVGKPQKRKIRKNFKHFCQVCAKRTWFSTTKQPYTIVCSCCGTKHTSTPEGKVIIDRKI